ncbi:MAG: Mur ligase family protein [Candidatus Daviesbacteria bacterium]|nr:Mur ligase family protein [Candidatus Daviesbacteria bacterium]
MKPINFLKKILSKKASQFLPASAYILISGTVGKTLALTAANLVLSSKYKTLAIQTSGNSFLNIWPNTEKVLIEISPLDRLEIEEKLNILKPQIGVVTMATFGSLEDFQKTESFSNLTYFVQSFPEDANVILNWDDLPSRKLAELTPAKVFFVGSDSVNCHLFASQIKTRNGRTLLELNYGVERVEIEVETLGLGGVNGVMLACAIGLLSEMSLFTIKKTLEGFKPLEHRMKLVEGLEGLTILDDTYDATLIGIDDSLDIIGLLPARHRFFILGGLEHSDLLEQDLKRLAQKICNDKVVDYIFTGGSISPFIEELERLGFAGKVEVGLSRSQIVGRVLTLVRIGDLVLIKGPRSTKMDEIVSRITKQTK